MQLSFLLAERWLNTSEALIGKDFPGKLLEVIVALFPLLALTHPALRTLSHLGQLTVFAHKAMKSLCEQTDFFRAVPTSSKLFQSFLYFLLLNLHILEVCLLFPCLLRELVLLIGWCGAVSGCEERVDSLTESMVHCIYT